MKFGTGGSDGAGPIFQLRRQSGGGERGRSGNNAGVGTGSGTNIRMITGTLISPGGNITHPGTFTLSSFATVAFIIIAGAVAGIQTAVGATGLAAGVGTAGERVLGEGFESRRVEE
jgi:hypothetical protein